MVNVVFECPPTPTFCKRNFCEMHHYYITIWKERLYIFCFVWLNTLSVFCEVCLSISLSMSLIIRLSSVICQIWHLIAYFIPKELIISILCFNFPFLNSIEEKKIQGEGTANKVWIKSIWCIWKKVCSQKVRIVAGFLEVIFSIFNSTIFKTHLFKLSQRHQV